jgi:Ca-activated chloride channel family protein
MVPHGWDFDAVMNRSPERQHRAALDPALIDRLAPGTPPAAGDAQARNGLALPATATPREWLILLGALMALSGLAWRVAQRRQPAC